MAWGMWLYPLMMLISTSRTHEHSLCTYIDESLTQEIDTQSIFRVGECEKQHWEDR